jgi:hypothetical protein
MPFSHVQRYVDRVSVLVLAWACESAKRARGLGCRPGSEWRSYQLWEHPRFYENLDYGYGYDYDNESYSDTSAKALVK